MTGLASKTFDAPDETRPFADKGMAQVVNIGDGVSRGMIFTNLKDWSERSRSLEEIIGEVQGQFFGIPGVFAFANNPPAFGWGSPVNFVIQHPDFDSLVRANDTLLARARTVKGLINVDSDLRVNKPQLTVSFDRDRAEGPVTIELATTRPIAVPPDPVPELGTTFRLPSTS